MTASKPNPKILSKSRIKSGVQCHKQLHLELNRKDLKSKPSPAQQAQFDEGIDVGRKAQELFPAGVLINKPAWDYQGGHNATQQAIADNAQSIFEASFLAQDLFVRVDILHKLKASSPWQIIEVKKSTSVKEDHILDVAIQLYVLKKAGIEVESCQVMVINNQCVAPDLSNLFETFDVTDEVAEILPQVEQWIEELKNLAGTPKEPPKEIGRHCTSPYECAFKAHCWKDLPKRTILELPGIKDKWALWEEGKRLIKDLDENEFSSQAKRAIQVVKSGERYVDFDGIQAELKNWHYPLYFLDFETIGPAIPIFDGTRPYNQVPFQLSCHVLEKPGDSQLEHFEFLGVDGTDPRPGIAQTLCEKIGETGSIVAYNKQFEAKVLRELAEAFPKLAKKLLSIESRLVDPLPIFRMWVYDENFEGSFSIKAVAPALSGAEASYDGLEVGDGEMAQLVAAKLMKNEVSDLERGKWTNALLEYCRKDTEGLVRLVGWLYNT